MPVPARPHAPTGARVYPIHSGNGRVPSRAGYRSVSTAGHGPGGAQGAGAGPPAWPGYDRPERISKVSAAVARARMQAVSARRPA
jgi:hypothetical protein